jgi:hypothetical protein
VGSGYHTEQYRSRQGKQCFLDEYGQVTDRRKNSSYQEDQSLEFGAHFIVWIRGVIKIGSAYKPL